MTVTTARNWAEIPLPEWLRGHAEGIRQQCEGKPLGGHYPVVPYTAKRLDEAAATITAQSTRLAELEAEVAASEAREAKLVEQALHCCVGFATRRADIADAMNVLCDLARAALAAAKTDESAPLAQ